MKRASDRKRRRPPRLARALLSLVVPPGRSRDGLLGDLEELYADRLTASGRVRADVWYVLEAAHASARYAGRRIRRRSGRGAGPRRRGSGTVVEAALQDLRFAARTLLRRPAFALTAVLTLGLGVGGTTAIFAVVDTVLLRDPPYANPGRLVNVWTTYPHWRGAESLDAFWDRIPLSYPEYEDWRAGVSSFASMAVYTVGPVMLTGAGPARRLTAGYGTASLGDVLGVPPALGRWFLPGEDVSGARLVVLGDGFWRRRFGADGNVIGRSVTIGEAAYEVIGVMPRGFALKNIWVPGDRGIRDVWLPLDLATDIRQRGNRAFDAIARLAPGVTLASALAESKPVLRGDTPPERRDVRMAFRREIETGGLRSPLLLLFGASALLLFIACGNVATMLLGEALGRRAEVATRTALGAGRGRILRQLLTESVLLGTVGALAGAVLATVLTKLLVTVGPPLPVAREIGVNPRVLLFASGLGVATGVLFGMAPALVLGSVGIRDAMRRGPGGRRRNDRSVQHGVLVLEIALTALLLVCAGLLTRTLLNLVTEDPGFRTDQIAVVEATASGPGISTDRFAVSLGRALDNIAAVPGVVEASGINTLPLLGGWSSTSLEIEGYRQASTDAPGPEAQRRVVFAGFHELLDVPLLSGRLLTAADDADAPLVMLVSERMALTYWPDGSPLGRRVRYDRRWWTVVGVVGDVRHESMDAEPVATYYVPYAQSPVREMTLLAKTRVETGGLLSTLRGAVQDADPGLVIADTHTMSSLVSRASASERYRALIVLVFAFTATVLAAVGIFGVTIRAVGRRIPELGVRIALGARVPALALRVIVTGVVTALAGVALGLGAAALVTRRVTPFLFGVRAHDPATYAAAAIVLLLTTIAAAWIATRRIARV
ncbi:MAG: ABC transporter permease, partial [Gemmatimonadota bacterium]